MDEEAIGEGDDFIREVREKVEELRDKEIERMQEEYDAQKKDTDEDFDPEKINRETLKIRIPEEILYKLLKAHLNHNDCRNRGYILDGYPRSFKDAQHCFLRTPDMPEGEEFEEEEVEEGQEKTFKGYIVDLKIIPQNCIVLTGNDDFLLKRVRDLPETAIAGTHYNAVDMIRRLKVYRTSNNSTIAEPSVSEFFARQGVQIFTESVTTPAKIALQAFKIYIERVSDYLLTGNRMRNLLTT